MSMLVGYYLIDSYLLDYKKSKILEGAIEKIWYSIFFIF